MKRVKCKVLLEAEVNGQTIGRAFDIDEVPLYEDEHGISRAVRMFNVTLRSMAALIHKERYDKIKEDFDAKEQIRKIKA